MNIAICDDEIVDLEALQHHLEKNSRINKIRKFLSARQLQDAIEKGDHFDLIFMDLEWNEQQNGIDFASKVNENCPDTQIIFVTGHPDRFYQRIFLKPVNLCGFLGKPVDATVLEKLIQKAWAVIRTQEARPLLIQHKGTIHSIPVHKIRYLESRGHQLTVHTTEDSVTCYERLEKLKEHLPKGFQQCHKSYLVNMDCIRHIEKDGILLNNGEALPVSKAKYAETRAAFFRYMGETL